MASLTAHRGRRRWRGGSGEETRWRGRGLEGGDVGEEGAGRRRGGGGAGLTIRVGASARVLTLLHVPHDERGARTDGIGESRPQRDVQPVPPTKRTRSSTGPPIIAIGHTRVHKPGTHTSSYPCATAPQRTTRAARGAVPGRV